MKKTIERMAENGPRKSKVVYPAEIGRAEWSLDNPPSAVGLKLLLLLVSSLGDAVADDVVHELPVSLLRQVPGLAGMSKIDLEAVLLDLARAQARLDIRQPGDPSRGVVSFGALLRMVRIEYSGDAVLSCRVRFGDVFREIVAASELFAVLDRAAALSMRSRYSLLLYQFLATHWNKSRQREIKLPLAELRRVFALSDDSYAQFKALKQRALSPAVAEVSAASRFKVTAKPYYEGSRAVAGVVLAWEAKAAPAAAPDAVKPSGKPSRKPHGAGAAKVAEKLAASDQDKLAYFAGLVRRKAPGVTSAVSVGTARKLLAAGLVTVAELRAVQIEVAN